jgi:HlyD family secretion protein
MSIFKDSERHVSRGGFTIRGLVISLAVLASLAFGGWFLMADSFSVKDVPPRMYEVKLGEFVHEITNRGSVESSSNVEIDCKVRSDKSSGSTILKIIPEGTEVEEGDELVVLDSYPLQKEMLTQQIVCNKSKANVIQSTNVYETAVIAKKEYIEGTYKQEVQTIESEIFVTMENLSRAEEYLKHSRRLFAKRYVTEAQLEADQFAVEKAKKDLAAARTKMAVLGKYTKMKMENQLEAAIRTAEAKLEAATASHDLDVEKLKLLEKQIGNCTILAPQAGQVVYASQSKGHRREAVVIEEGAVVREGQAIIRLPDSSKMQVKAAVNEAKVTLVKEGMAAIVRLDAFPDVALEGVVDKVNEYPEPPGWGSSSSREYKTTVRIIDKHNDLKPGMTAEVRIQVQRIPKVLNVPVQTIFQHGGKFYCIFYEKGKLKQHEVKIGPSNDKVIVILEGLTAGQKIVHHTAAVRDKLNLPKEEKPTNGRLPHIDGKEGSPGKKPGGGSRPKAPNLGQIFDRLDKNKNDKIDADEMPPQMKTGMKNADTNGDGAIDRQEMTAAMARFGKGRPGGKP